MTTEGNSMQQCHIEAQHTLRSSFGEWRPENGLKYSFHHLCDVPWLFRSSAANDVIDFHLQFPIEIISPARFKSTATAKKLDSRYAFKLFFSFPMYFYFSFFAREGGRRARLLCQLDSARQKTQRTRKLLRPNRMLISLCVVERLLGECADRKSSDPQMEEEISTPRGTTMESTGTLSTDDEPSATSPSAAKQHHLGT